MKIPDHLTCLLWTLYPSQEATVRIGHGTIDWFQIGKGVSQGCILSLCLFNLHVDHIMWNAGLEEAQAARKAMANLDSVLKSRDITLPTKVCIAKAMVISVVTYGCESWTIKMAEHQRLMLLNYGDGEDSWESLGLQGDQTSQSWRKSIMSIQ